MDMPMVDPAGGLDWTLYLTFFLNGLSEASHMFLLAAGLSLIFGVMRVLNLAHGALHIAGIYVALSLMAWGANWWAALLVAPLVVAGFGALMEVGLLRPMYRRHPSYVLILTFGVVLILHDLFKIGWGVDWKLLPEPPLVSGTVEVAGIYYPGFYLFGIALAGLVGLLLWYFIERTRPGRLLRAAAEDREMAAALGVDVRRLYTLTFAIGCFLTAFGGVLMGTVMSITPSYSFDAMLYAFAVVVIGGLGSLGGAALGTFLVGQLNAFGLLVVPEWDMAFMFLLMAAVLILRPRGLFGRETS